MKKKSGTIWKMRDDRTVIVYNDQPLKEKVILTLLNHRLEVQKHSNGKPKILILDFKDFNNKRTNEFELIGLVD